MGPLLQVIWWTLDQQLEHGDHESNLFLLILQLNTNILQQLKPQNKLFGFIKYLKTCRRNKWLQCLSLLTTIMQLNWPRIQNSMIEPNISTPNITYRSRKQYVPAYVPVDSTTEVEYVPVAHATKEIIYLPKILVDLHEKQMLHCLSLLTTHLQFNWTRIKNSMIEPNISTPNTTWFYIMLRPKPFISHTVLL